MAHALMIVCVNVIRHNLMGSGVMNHAAHARRDIAGVRATRIVPLQVTVWYVQDMELVNIHATNQNSDSVINCQTPAIKSSIYDNS